MEKSSSQYDSFLFWRQPIPALDLSELEDLGLIDSQLANSGKGKDKLRGQDEEARGQPTAWSCLWSLGAGQRSYDQVTSDPPGTQGLGTHTLTHTHTRIVVYFESHVQCPLQHQVWIILPLKKVPNTVTVCLI